MLAVLLGPGMVHAQAVNALALPPTPQAQFEEGVRRMFAGEHEQAEAIFAALYQQTGALRVKLEWARAAFLGKRYNLSRRLFDEILEENLPDAVRFNIAIYLNEIARQGGDMTDYGVTFVNDSNPFLVSQRQTIWLYGLPFDYEPAHKPERLAGAQAYLSHYRALNDAETLRLLFDGDHTQYEGRNNSKTNLRLALQVKRNTGDNLSLNLGVDHYFERGHLLIRQPYVGLRWREDHLTGPLNQIQLDARLSKNEFPDYDYMQGNTRSFSGIFAKNLTQTLQLGVTAHVDDAPARLPSQSYRTVSLGGWGQVFIPWLASSVQLGHTATRRKFAAMDEFFAVDRRDWRRDTHLIIRPFEWKIGTLYPALVVGHTESRSNIPIYQYKNTWINVSLRKNF
jgi:hypothetical protein